MMSNIIAAHEQTPSSKLFLRETPAMLSLASALINERRPSGAALLHKSPGVGRHGGQLPALYASLLELVQIEASGRRSLEKRIVNASPMWRNKSIRRSLKRANSMRNNPLDGAALEGAFLAMAASRTTASWRCAGRSFDDTDITMINAKMIEAEVVAIIRSVGETVVNSKFGTSCVESSRGSVRAEKDESDGTFEYFCDKGIMKLLCEMVGMTPTTSGASDDKLERGSGVVYSPLVKAQILHTITLIVSKPQNDAALYAILSQHCVSQLLAIVLPLHQWTDAALDIMLPAYVSLMKQLSLHIVASPRLFPFYTVEDTIGVCFPLFSALLEVATSSYARSHAFTQLSCLKYVVDVMQIDHKPLQDWIGRARHEQDLISLDLCYMLDQRFRHMVSLTTGLVVDPVRSNAVHGQLNQLDDQLIALNDFLECANETFCMSLCETILHRVVRPIVLHLLPRRRKMLQVGESDHDVIPECEASAQVATVFMSRLFARVFYLPLLRMLLVALLHPLAPTSMLDDIDNQDVSSAVGCKRRLTADLNAVAKGQDCGSTHNLFREEICKALRSEYGEWRCISAALLVDRILTSVPQELRLLRALTVLPTATTAKGESVADAAIQSLELDYSVRHGTSIQALECLASLIFRMILLSRTDCSQIESDDTEQLLLRAMLDAKSVFGAKVLQHHCTGGSPDLLLNVMEDVVTSKYVRTNKRKPGLLQGPIVYAYNLAQCGSGYHMATTDALVRRKASGSSRSSAVEQTRFLTEMAVHFRGMCRLLVRAQVIGTTSDWMDESDALADVFDALNESATIGTDLDLRGRTLFAVTIVTIGIVDDPNHARGRTLSDDLVFCKGAQLILVIDPTLLYVVKPIGDRSRGVIVCRVPLSDVIALAPDECWLHLAVRHDDVGSIIKNGNMALHFDTFPICAMAAQYVERSRSLVRRQMYQLLEQAFAEEKGI